MAPHVLLFGATGASGLAFIKHALALPDPPRLTLYVRDASKLPQNVVKAHTGRVIVVMAPLTDAAALDRAMPGVHAVVSVLGAYPSLRHFVTRAKATPIADAFVGVVACMKRHGVKRLLTLLTRAHKVDGEVYTRTQWLTQVVLASALLPQAAAEMTALAKVARDPALDWTVFRVPQLTDGASDIPVHAGPLGPDHKGKDVITRESMVVWIHDEILHPKFIRQEPAISN